VVLLDAIGSSLAVMPWRNTSPTTFVGVFDTETGQPLQRVALSRPTGHVDVVVDDLGWLLLTDREVIALSQQR
jgi:hypothetical protein